MALQTRDRRVEPVALGDTVGLGRRAARSGLSVIDSVFRVCGGWLRLFGPILFYDLVRTGRRRRYLVVRGVYALFLAATLFCVYACWFLGESEPLKAMFAASLPAAELAEFAAWFFYVFIVIQLLVVFVLTPAYAAGVLAEEKERQTLEALLATDLSSREIVLGLFVSRLLNLTLLVATGLPILALLQFVGGIEPSLLLASFAFTGLTMISLAGLSVLNSVLARKPRDAIVRTYLAAFVYLAATGVSWLALLPGLGLAGFPSTETWRSPITIEDVVEWSNSGNLVAVIVNLVLAVRSGLRLSALLPSYLRDYAMFHGVVALGSCLWAVARLRSATLEPDGWPKRETPVRLGKARPAWHRWVPHSRIGQRPMLWKELNVDVGPRRRWYGWLMLGIAVALVFWPAIGVMAFFDRIVSHVVDDRLGEIINVWVRGVGTIVACFMLLQVAVRAAGSVSGERDRQTLDSLLATPLRNRSILYAKWLGSILSIRGAWLLLGAIWLIGIVCGGLHPLAIPCIVAAWLVFAAFLSAVGLWFSVASRTTRHATVLTLLAILALMVAAYLASFDLAGTPLPELEALCLFPPFTLGMLAFTSAELYAFLPRLLHWHRLFFVAEIAIWTFAAFVIWRLANIRFRVVTGRSSRPIRRRTVAAPPGLDNNCPRHP